VPERPQGQRRAHRRDGCLLTLQVSETSNKLNVQSMSRVTHVGGVRLVGRSYPMSAADGEIQAAARVLADELQPHEVTAELRSGEFPWPAGSPTGPCRSSGAAATCARTWPSAFDRELRVDRIWEGTSEIQRAIIADQLAKRGIARLTGEETAHDRVAASGDPSG
jgi:Acyl-CoA dehydrogenase, C-terminal domain